MSKAGLALVSPECSGYVPAMRDVDQPELRFLILRGLQMIPVSVLKNMAQGAPVTRQPALERATSIVHERLSHLEYSAPDALKNHG